MKNLMNYLDDYIDDGAVYEHIEKIKRNKNQNINEHTNKSNKKEKHKNNYK